jgi:hypothetical protein
MADVDERPQGDETEVLIVLAPAAGDAVHQVEDVIEATGGRLVQAYGARVCIAIVPSARIGALQEEPHVEGLYTGVAPQRPEGALEETARLGLAAWNARHETSFEQRKRARVGEGVPWDHPDFEREG